MTSLKKNFLWNASYQVLLVLAPLVTTPYLSRVLGAEQVGVYSYTYSIANYFVIFAALGMANYGVRTVSSAGSDRALRSRLFWGAYASQLVVAVPVATAYFAYLLAAPQGGLLVAATWSLWVVSAALDVTWLFFGVEEFRLPTERSFATKLLSIVAIFLFVRGPEDLWVYCLAISASYFANQVLMWPFVGRYVDLVRPSWADVRRHFGPNLRLFAPVVAISLYTALDKIMLGAISGMEQAGYYEYAEKISKMPMSVITALGTVMLPRMTSALAAGRRGEARRLLEGSMWVMQAAAMGLTFGIAAAAPEFCPVFFGPGYDECARIMPVVAAAIPIISASNVIGVQYMLPTFSDRAYTLSVCAGAVVNVGLNLVLLEPFGALGAAVATVAAELAVLVFQCWVVKGELPVWRYVWDAVPFAVCGALMLVIVRLAAGLLGAPGVTSLCLEVGVGVIAYFLLAIAWCACTGGLPRLKALLRV